VETSQLSPVPPKPAVPTVAGLIGYIADQRRLGTTKNSRGFSKVIVGTPHAHIEHDTFSRFGSAQDVTGVESRRNIDEFQFISNRAASTAPVNLAESSKRACMCNNSCT
jgi:hypothetical protein